MFVRSPDTVNTACASKPSVPSGTRNVVRPSWRSLSGSVRARRNTKSVTCALVVNIFCPSITHPSSTGRARVWTVATSEPASGSLMPRAMVASPRDDPREHLRLQPRRTRRAWMTRATIIEVDTA